MVLEDYKELVSTTATITTIIQFLTGITVCKKFVTSGTTGEISSVPFVSIITSAKGGSIKKCEIMYKCIVK